MSFDLADSVSIDLIVMTDDRAHARDILAGLDRNQHQYLIREVARRESMLADLEAAVESARGLRPVIVFLDCEFLRGQVEMVAAHILSRKRVMAIECVATRPPAEPSRRMQLAILGVHLFDGFTASSAIIALH
ncbi:MAG: hypothetical protein AB7T59_00125 [Hyphomonadaceae bacterium]